MRVQLSFKGLWVFLVLFSRISVLHLDSAIDLYDLIKNDAESGVCKQLVVPKGVNSIPRAVPFLPFNSVLDSYRGVRE